MTAPEHFLAWLTPERYKMLNALAFDRAAGRPLQSFARFMKRDKYYNLERTGLTAYYPFLRLVGYLPPTSVWEPTTPLTDDETSTDLRRWFTPLRRQLISRRAIDDLSERPRGVLSRYLNGEKHVKLKFGGLAHYYPVLKLLGYVPPQ